MAALVVATDSQIEVSRLEVLAEEIRQHEIEAQEYAETALAHKVEIGRRLIEAKELLAHGQFLAWARQEFGYEHSSVQRHVTLARNYPRVGNLPKGASLRMALAAIREPSHAVEQILPGDPRTLVYAFNACTVFVNCACGKEAGGVMELTEGGNADFSCAKCGRKYSVEARVRGGKK